MWGSEKARRNGIQLYARGSQTFSVHGTLCVSEIFMVPSPKEITEFKQFKYLYPNNVVAIGNNKTQKVKEKLIFLNFILKQSQLLNEMCAPVVLCTASQTWVSDWVPHPHFLSHAGFCADMLSNHSNCRKTSFAKI